MGARLAKNDDDCARREIKRCERLRHAPRWVERTSHPGPNTRDVIDTIDDERDPAIGFQITRPAEAGDKRLLVGGKSRALILNKSRIRPCESPDEAPEDGFHENAFKALAIGVSEVAVVLRDQPALIGQSIEKLLADPRLAVSRRSFDKQMTTISGALACCVHELPNRRRPPDLEGPINWV